MQPPSTSWSMSFLVLLLRKMWSCAQYSNLPLSGQNMSLITPGQGVRCSPTILPVSRALEALGSKPEWSSRGLCWRCTCPLTTPRPGLSWAAGPQPSYPLGLCPIPSMRSKRAVLGTIHAPLREGQLWQMNPAHSVFPGLLWGVCPQVHKGAACKTISSQTSKNKTGAKAAHS